MRRQEKCCRILTVVAGNATIRLVCLAATAQQQVGGSGTAVLGLGCRDGQDVPPQLRFLEPARYGALEDPRSYLAETAPCDDKHTAPSRIARCSNEFGKRPMGLRLRHAVQIEPGIDPVKPTLQSLGISSIDPGKAGERRPVRCRSRARFRLGRSAG